MNLLEFQNSLTAPEPAYLVESGQDYVVKQIVELARNQVDEAARTFDWAVFDLNGDSVREVIDLAKTLPWLSARRWIHVKNAQEGKEALLEYLKQPSSRTVLILENNGRKGALGKKIAAVQIDESGAASRMIRARLESEGFRIEPGAVNLLVELVGADLHRLETEVEKQILHGYEGKEITRESILKLTMEGRERDVFELIAAIAERNAERALRLLSQLMQAGMSPLQIQSMLYWNFKRLLAAREMLQRGQPFFPIVKELNIWSYKSRERDVRNYSPEYLRYILLQLRLTDRLSKSTSADPQGQLQRLIIDTCRSGSL
ncbi:MAG TPA: DNA polymerase III subunit delta [Acidobacteriota bacterium]|nr:DNA polymerase III subunit delta [Acidobacteriota bacterium]